MAARASIAEDARRALPVTAALERRFVQCETKGPSGVLRPGGMCAVGKARLPYSARSSRLARSLSLRTCLRASGERAPVVSMWKRTTRLRLLKMASW